MKNEYIVIKEYIIYVLCYGVTKYYLFILYVICLYILRYNMVFIK